MADKCPVVLENDVLVVNFAGNVFVVAVEDGNKAFGTKKEVVNSFVVFPFVTFDRFVVDTMNHCDHFDSIDGYVVGW